MLILRKLFNLRVATMPKKAILPVRLYEHLHLMQALLNQSAFHFGTGVISDSSESIGSLF